ncbi:MAG: tetratricopeptide repeat protein, partial [Acidobacteria bacterium]
AGAIFSILLHSLVDFNLQIPINWVVFCMVLGLAWGRTPVRTAMGWKAKTLTAAVVTLFFVWAAWTVIKESVSMQIADRETIPGFEEALTWIPDQPAYHFAVGLLYRDNLEHQDLEQAGEHLEAATRLNPREWVYWQEVGRYYEFMGETERAEKAMLTCLEIMPLYASERWRLGNFYLREGRVAEALEQVKRAIELNPDYREATLMVFWKAGLGEQELDRVWPGDKESRLMRVRFLVRNGASGEEIDRQWRQAAKAAEPAGITLEDAAFYLDHLSRQKAFDELRRQWVEINASGGRRDPDFEQGVNLVWNGRLGLALEAGLLDWRIPRSEAYEAKVEKSVLKIELKGTENISLGIVQRVIVPKPGQYVLTVKARSEEITTEQGPYFRVVDAATGKLLAEMEQIRGSRATAEQVVLFQVPEGTRTISVELRRNPSKRIDNKIRGTLWIEQVAVRRES